MKKLLVVLTLVTAAGACRDRADREGGEARKPVESETADEDFDHTRSTYEAQARERLAQIDARIRELGARGEVKARAAAEELRVQRDRLAKELDEAGQQAKPHWDRFESEVSRGLDDLDRRLNAAYDAFTRD